MKKFVISAALLLTAVGCTAVNDPTNQTAAPVPENVKADTTPAPAGSSSAVPPATNPSTPAAPSTAPPPADPVPAPVVSTPAPVIPPPPAGSKEAPSVTKQQIDAIALNSTYDEVSAKLGLGKLISSNEHQAIYQYQGKNGGTAKLTFWDGKLNSKGMSDLN